MLSEKFKQILFINEEIDEISNSANIKFYRNS